MVVINNSDPFINWITQGENGTGLSVELMFQYIRGPLARTYVYFNGWSFPLTYRIGWSFPLTYRIGWSFPLAYSIGFGGCAVSPEPLPLDMLQPLRKHAHPNILIVSPSKTESFWDKKSNILHISAQNIVCGYSLEPPRRGGPNE